VDLVSGCWHHVHVGCYCQCFIDPYSLHLPVEATTQWPLQILTVQVHMLVGTLNNWSLPGECGGQKSGMSGTVRNLQDPVLSIQAPTLIFLFNFLPSFYFYCSCFPLPTPSKQVFHCSRYSSHSAPPMKQTGPLKAHCSVDIAKQTKMECSDQHACPHCKNQQESLGSHFAPNMETGGAPKCW